VATETATFHEVQLSASEWLRLDVAGGLVRIAYYRLPRWGEKGWEGVKAWRQKHGKLALVPLPEQLALVRVSAFDPTLAGVLLTVLGEAESKSDERTVEAYIRATAWGAELP
jgi:hypothetical protein